MTDRLDGTAALITGASSGISGIGEAVAVALLGDIRRFGVRSRRRVGGWLDRPDVALRGVWTGHSDHPGGRVAGCALIRGAGR